jgi:Gpi18-like mannosyltransferase
LFDGAVVQLTLKRCLSLSVAVAGIASVAIYVLAYLLFTIHEEIGIPADAALPLALWTFPVVFLASLVGYLLWKTDPGIR